MGSDILFFLLCTGDQPGADLGPLITPQSKQRVCDLIQSGIDQGAKVNSHLWCFVVSCGNLILTTGVSLVSLQSQVELDGRGIEVKGYEKGNFVGPTVISGVTVREYLLQYYGECMVSLWLEQQILFTL